MNRRKGIVIVLTRRIGPTFEEVCLTLTYRLQEGMDSSACPNMSQLTITQLQGYKIIQHFY